MPVSRRQALVAAAAAVALAGGGATWWWAAAGSGPAPVAAPSASGSPTPTPTTAAPTPTPTTAAPEPQPTAPAAQPGDPAATPAPAPAAPDAGPAEVDVVTTYAGWNDLSRSVEVGAYVALVESDGSCTVTLTGPGGTVTADAAATPDASTTACGELAVPGTSLGTGSWQAVVTYSSPRSTGVGAPVTVEVP